MEKTNLYLEIEKFLTSHNFSTPTEDQPAFRCQIMVPGRTVIINGQRMDEKPKPVVFDIMPLGTGAILGDPEKELQGYNILDNDIWVESLDDFKFWFIMVMKGASTETNQ